MNYSALTSLNLSNPLVRAGVGAVGAQIYNTLAPQRWGDVNPILAGTVAASGHAPVALSALGAASLYNAITPGPDISGNIAVGGALLAPHVLSALGRAANGSTAEQILDGYLQSGKSYVKDNYNNFKASLHQPVEGGSFQEARSHLQDFLNKALNYGSIHAPGGPGTAAA